MSSRDRYRKERLRALAKYSLHLEYLLYLISAHIQDGYNALPSSQLGRLNRNQYLSLTLIGLVLCRKTHRYRCNLLNT